MQVFTVNQTFHLITVRTAELELGWSGEDGALRLLRVADGPNIVGSSAAHPAVDVALSAPGNWLAQRSFVRYLSHHVSAADEEVVVVINVGLGPLKLADTYRIKGCLLTRHVGIINVSTDDMRIYGLRLALPNVRLSHAQISWFEAPGNSVRPRVPFTIAAAQHRNMLPRRFFAPGLRDGSALEPAPTRGPGLLALTASGPDETLLCWYHSETEPALPYVEGHPPGPAGEPAAVSLVHELYLTGWLRPDEIVTGGHQYVLFTRSGWADALYTFRDYLFPSSTQRSADGGERVRDAVIYETHPALHGGFRGLAMDLRDLASLGVNTLVLLPIWEFANARQTAWDGSWSDSGSPYAISRYESLDATLGSAGDLHALIDRAHSLGIRVLLDLPLHGCAPSSPYVEDHPDWFARDETGAFQTASRFGAAHPGAYCYSFDWSNPDVQVFLHGWALDLARSYAIDGFRVVQPYSSALNWSRRQPARASAASLALLPMLRRLRHDLRQLRPDAILICDMAGPVYTQIHDACYDDMAHLMFVHLALNRVTPAELGDYLRDSRAVLPPGCPRICFTERHDTCDFNPLADGLRGSRISRMLLAGMILCGYVPSLWSRQEQGEELALRELLRVWRENPVLRSGEFLFNQVSCDSPRVFAVLRLLEGSCVLGLLNVDPYRRTVNLTLPVEDMGLPAGVYGLHELVSGLVWSEHGHSTWNIDQLRHVQLTLDPFGAYFLAIEPVETPSSPVYAMA